MQGHWLEEVIINNSVLTHLTNIGRLELLKDVYGSSEIVVTPVDFTPLGTHY